MPLLGPDDPLPSRPMRVVVSGTSGSGKSTLACRIADRLDLPYTEWTRCSTAQAEVPRESFRIDVERLIAESRSVTEFQYDAVRPSLAERADLFVRLDIPRHVVMSRLVRRTVSRARNRTVLWNGEREPPLHAFLTDRDHVIRYASRGHAATETAYDELLTRTAARRPTGGHGPQ